MKYRKIFTFILLLCTIFGTLLFINPTSKAETTTTPPSDLTGYTVTVPSGWTCSSNYGYYQFTGTIEIVGGTIYNEVSALRIGYKGISVPTPSANSILGFFGVGESTSNRFLIDPTHSFKVSFVYGIDVTNQDLIQWFVDNNATFDNGIIPIYPSVTVNQNSLSSVDITSSSDIYYMINNSNYWVPFITSQSSFPYTIDNVSSIQFKNDNLQYDLIIYNYNQELLTLSSGTISRVFEVTEPLDLSLALFSSTYIISGQYQFNNEITWLYDTSEQEGILYLPFYVYNLDNPTRVNYDYMLNQYREDLDINYFLYANENDSGTFIGQYAGRFTTSTTINMFNERIVYFYTAEVSEGVYTWLNENGQFINNPTLDPNNPDNPNSGNNPNNPNNPDFGTDTVRQIVNQVNAFLGIQILPGLSFRDILLICIALPLLMYILKVFLGG